jgi:hypothetical protein
MNKQATPTLTGECLAEFIGTGLLIFFGVGCVAALILAGANFGQWEIEHIEMAVPISPEELRAKRNSILKHQSQMESAPFMGNDERLFWQRSEERNRGTAALYDSLGLASYEAMEAFVEYIPL